MCAIGYVYAVELFNADDFDRLVQVIVEVEVEAGVTLEVGASSDGNAKVQSDGVVWGVSTVLPQQRKTLLLRSAEPLKGARARAQRVGKICNELGCADGSRAAVEGSTLVVFLS